MKSLSSFAAAFCVLLASGAALAQPGVCVNRVRLADRAELAAPLVHHEPDPAERLEPPPET